MKPRLFSSVLILGFMALGMVGAREVCAQERGHPPSDSSGVNASTAGEPAVSFGTYGNPGYGTNGFTAVPGLTILLDHFPIGMHFTLSPDSLQVVMNADWLALDRAIPGTPFSWFAGPGIYAGWASVTGDPDYFLGGFRGVIGARVAVFDVFEAYVSLVPALGVGFLDGQQSWLWNVDAEIGLRYVFGTKTGRDGSGNGRSRRDDRGAIRCSARPGCQVHDYARRGSRPLILARRGAGASRRGSAGRHRRGCPRQFSRAGRKESRRDYCELRSCFQPRGTPSTLAVVLDPKEIEGIASWSFDIISADHTAVRRFSGTGALPRDLSWDGKDADGRIVGGTYTGSVSIVYDDGAECHSDLAPVLLDAAPPAITARLPDGFLFTPDGGGTSDTLVLAVEALDASPIDSWTFDIEDPTGKAFYHREGSGPLPDTLTWDGTAASGELVQSAQKYTYRLTATDCLSKQGRATGEIRTGFLLTTKSC